VKGVNVLIARVKDARREQLRVMVDDLRNQLGESVVVLGTATQDGAVEIVGGVTKNLTAKIHAGKLITKLSQAVGGKGGGRPDMAEGGGKDPSALDQALRSARTELEAML